MEDETMRRTILLSIFASMAVTLLALASVPAMGAVDPDHIIFNEMGDPITDGVELFLENETRLYYNVYDASGDPIGTIDTWNYTGHDVVNITASIASNSFTVKALKAGTATLTLTAKGDTKSISKDVRIMVKAPIVPTKTNTTNTTPNKGFIPGFEVLPVLAGAGLAALVICRRLRG